MQLGHSNGEERVTQEKDNIVMMKDYFFKTYSFFSAKEVQRNRAHGDISKRIT